MCFCLLTVFFLRCILLLWSLGSSYCLFVFLQTSTAAQHSTAQKRGFCFPFLLIFTRLVFSCSSINRLFVTYLLAYSHTASVHTYIGGMKAYSSFGLSLPCLPACLPIFQFFREKTSFFLSYFRCSYRTAFLSSFSVR